jgi:predicted PP-loop superfamily ATPase
MASYMLRKESKQILEQMGVDHYDKQFVCPVLKVLQMRHNDLDIDSAVKIIKELINE